MSSGKDKNISTNALLEMDKIKASIKEESKKTLQTLLSEAVKTAIREEAQKEEGEEEPEYEVQDDAQQPTEDGAETDAAAAEGEDVAPEAEGEAQEEPVEGEEGVEPDTEEDADAQDVEQYNVGDDTYDLTGAKDFEDVVKVYKRMKDTDDVIVTKQGTKVTLQDNGNDAEYVIDLGDDEMEEPMEDETQAVEEPMGDEVAEEPVEGEEVADQELNEEFEIDLGDKESEDEESEDEESEDEKKPWHDDPEIEAEEELGTYEPDEDEVDDEEFEDEVAGLHENNKRTRKAMKESKETIFEVDLGYTDDYQEKDPIAGLSNTEPSKKGRSWDKGLPTGTEKPWAGKQTKKTSEPFVNEDEEMECNGPVCEEDDELVDEGTNVTLANGRHKSKSHTPKQKEGAKTMHHDSKAGEYKAIDEVKQENKELKESIIALRKSLNEAYVTNVNLGKITKLFIENTTSQAEKVEIVNRFCNEAKTVEQSKTLYESISKELKKAGLNKSVNENKVVAAKPLNENKVEKSKDLIETIDFMKRVMNC